MPRCAQIAQMTHAVYMANVHLLGEDMAAERLTTLSRCVALRTCLGCDWDGTVFKEMSKLRVPRDAEREHLIDDLVMDFQGM